MKNHPTASIPLYIAIMLERLVYYGSRSIFVLYLMDSTINLSISEAYSTYGWLATLLLFSQIAAGLIGLINQPRLLTIIGYAMQVVGASIISIMQTRDGLIIGFFLLVIGSGFSKINSTALLAKVYQKSALLHSAVMINYAAINIGAFLGTLLIGLLASFYSYQVAFYFCAAIMLVALILILIVSPKSYVELKVDQKNSSYITTLIVVTSIVVGLFWLCYNYLYELISSSSILASSEALIEFNFKFSYNLNFVLLLIVTFILAIYLTFKRIHVTALLALGFGCGIIAVLMLSYALNGNLSAESLYVPLLAFYIFITFAEIFIGPPLTAYILEKVNMMYIPLVIAGYYSFTTLLAQGVGLAYEHDITNTISACLIILGLSLAGMIVLAKVRPKEIQHETYKDELID